jgi:hypothetical protein
MWHVAHVGTNMSRVESVFGGASRRSSFSCAWNMIPCFDSS